jgi:hypothetical protein
MDALEASGTPAVTAGAAVVVEGGAGEAEVAGVDEAPEEGWQAATSRASPRDVGKDQRVAPQVDMRLVIDIAPPWHFRHGHARAAGQGAG